MSKINIKQLKELLVDEQSASREYNKLAGRAATKGEKQRLRAMAKDEARHAKYVKEMIDRRK